MDEAADGLKEKFAKIESLIQQRKLVEANKRIRALSRGTPKRELLYPLARLMRLAFWPEKTLALLGRIVRPSARTAETATAGEKAEYAFALGLLGGYHEAHELLGSIDSRTCPDALFFRAVLYVQLTDYLRAEKHLLECIAIREISLDVRFGVEGYLASVMMHGKGDYAGAKALLLDVVERGTTHSFAETHLVGNWMLLAQNEFLNGSIKQGLEYVRKVYERMPKEKMSRYLWCRVRSRELLLMLKARPSAELEAELAQVCDELAKMRRWHHAIYARMYLARLRDDRTELERLYFGLRYPAMRSTLLKLFSVKVSALPSSYRLRLGPARGDAEIDVTNGRNSRNDSFLKEGQVPQRLLLILGSGFCIPYQLVELHALLFPKEHFNVKSSPDRVYKAIIRLREWLAGNMLPLEVHEDDGYYTLRSQEGCTLVIPNPDQKNREPRVPSKVAKQLRELAQKFGESSFSAQEGADHFGVSKKTMIRLMNEGEKLGFVLRKGTGSMIRYTIEIMDEK